MCEAFDELGEWRGAYFVFSYGGFGAARGERALERSSAGSRRFVCRANGYPFFLFVYDAGLEIDVVPFKRPELCSMGTRVEG